VDSTTAGSAKQDIERPVLIERKDEKVNDIASCRIFKFNLLQEIE